MAGAGDRITRQCVCGHSIIFEVRSEGDYIGFLAFFDGEPGSESYGERVKRCPGCAEQLGFPLFFRKG
jgi:hypothetical protein